MLIALFAALASASPLTLAWQGRLTDASGTPIQGDVALDLVLYDAPADGEVIHTESLSSVSAEDGFVSVRIGAQVDNRLDSADLLGGAWLAVSVDTVAIGGLHELVSVPYAGVASELDGTARLTDTTEACTAETLGVMRFRGDAFEGCTSEGWQRFVAAGADGGVTVDGPLTVTGSLAANSDLSVGAGATIDGGAVISGGAAVTGDASISGSASVGGEVSSLNTYWRDYSISSSVTAPLTPDLSGSWAAVVSCAITGTTSSGSSVWLIKRSDAIYVNRIASFGSTGSNTPQIYASGLNFRIKLYDHSQVYGVRCHFTELI